MSSTRYALAIWLLAFASLMTACRHPAPVTPSIPLRPPAVITVTPAPAPCILPTLPSPAPANARIQIEDGVESVLLLRTSYATIIDRVLTLEDWVATARRCLGARVVEQPTTTEEHRP